MLFKSSFESIIGGPPLARFGILAFWLALLSFSIALAAYRKRARVYRAAALYYGASVLAYAAPFLAGAAGLPYLPVALFFVAAPAVAYEETSQGLPIVMSHARSEQYARAARDAATSRSAAGRPGKPAASANNGAAYAATEEPKYRAAARYTRTRFLYAASAIEKASNASQNARIPNRASGTTPRIDSNELFNIMPV